MAIDPEFYKGIKSLVLLDLDDTVLDPTKQCSPRLVPSLQLARANGHLLGWASSTSDKGLLNWESLLGFPRGLLTVRLSEDGVRITGPPGMLPDNGNSSRSNLVLLSDLDRCRTQVAALRSAVQSAAGRARWAYSEQHPSTWAMRAGPQGPGHPAIVVVDVTRVASFTCEVRAIDPTNGSLSTNRDLTKLAEGWVRDAANRIGVPTKLLESGHGWIDLPHPTARKEVAMLALRDLVPPHVGLTLVGNGVNDVVRMDGVKLVAVQNAAAKLKAAAHLVTRASFSDGVIEYLESLS
ncbi:MAG: hypothetical protein COW24_01345 [Candidatus Kerfeldbacteria bacterium CG15_BIG_FIL_POST_REV_8_21_14_020_45_12]|uniref:Sucrose phosphatase-like domain-containing protein n=1 Tax=Candidatus Kerfeldbacteria bacterium CG15_BIG_FIL_POST_REV_8_21_14_020_45_12 TaxID=2014247 RepID=A0A2M7H4Q0_9BACT|nr:MAG: hypothetical protein COW24_01345 [Candidatus Kerfeldbacteria bacterium CG15_BIG_FIL_POST_REV_8_21_14_020_45_12]PJA93379.1 MAG: hypothetical protein CO132_03415 [Candidatus Kerfeldbacteria bacterium CG_4_9_14_3_um_filter_45_8]